MTSTTEDENALGLAILRKWRGLSPATARLSAQVSALTKADRKTTVQALANLLTFAAGQFNVGKNLTDVQTAILARDLLDTYWHYRFDEFAFVLREAVRGRYGTSYDRVDAPTVHGWCLRYEADRAELLTDEAEQQARQFKLFEQGKAQLPATAPSAAVQALRAKIEQMDNQTLANGLAYYEGLPAPTAEEQLKLEVAREVVGERKAAYYLAQLAARFPAGSQAETSSEQLRREQEFQRVKAEYFTQKMHREAQETGAEVVEESRPALASGPFPPACPKCTQRLDQCICPSPR